MRPVRATEEITNPQIAAPNITVPDTIPDTTPDTTPEALGESSLASTSTAAIAPPSELEPLSESLSEPDQPATTVEDWMTDIAQSLVQITGVRVETTGSGLQVVLETTEGDVLTPMTRSIGNAFIADFSNAVLALPDANEYSQSNPIEGIALVNVTRLPGNQVRVAITGTGAPPTAEVNLGDRGLVLSVVPGTEGADTNEEDIQVVVTGEQDEGYNPSSATTATRTDTPIRDIPQSIQVIPRQVLEDQQVTRLQDALQNVSGVTRQGNYGGGEGGAYRIRGFEQEGNFRNGFRDNDFYSISDPANIEQIEVLRGPSSVLFGQAQPGGIINIITEQPTDQPYYSFEFTGGQFSFYRPELDISGPIANNGDLRYRLNLAYQNSGSFRDYNHTERFFVAPVLTWDISDNTTVTFNFEYLYNDPVFDRGLEPIRKPLII
ncbi:MAG: TonB-dependent receptor plug domain-containing protein [Leptolyngbyaceae cyanobacterium CSU_1_4]|nr:TonB-dependent receptor plug domain-containing protein [Leptolyngbyaceae cyanobacterium CSU_1_4]